MEDTVLPCAEKLAFDDKAQAENSAVTIKWRHGTKLKAYKCVHCDLWHLATSV